MPAAFILRQAQDEGLEIGKLRLRFLEGFEAMRLEILGDPARALVAAPVVPLHAAADASAHEREGAQGIEDFRCHDHEQ